MLLQFKKSNCLMGKEGVGTRVPRAVLKAPLWLNEQEAPPIYDVFLLFLSTSLFYSLERHFNTPSAGKGII